MEESQALVMARRWEVFCEELKDLTLSMKTSFLNNAAKGMRGKSIVGDESGVKHERVM